MKVAFATSSFLGGGITSYAHEFINNFSSHNELSVLIGDDSKFPIKNNNVQIYRVEGSDCTVSNAKIVIKLLNETIRPDVLIISNSHVVALVVPFLVSSIRVITVSHSLKYIEADIAAINHRYCDRVIALSEYNREYIIQRFKADKNKVSVVYNFVNDYPSADTIVERKKQSVSPISIVYMGGSSGSKSPDIVLNILKELIKEKDLFEFYWVGADTPPLKRLQLFDRISSLFPISENRIHFTGHIKRDEVSELLEKADLLLIPSRREGCPMALLEALRVGTVAIVADYKNACIELIRDGVNGFVVKHNQIKQFSKVIIDFARNKTVYSSYYDNAYLTYKDQLSTNKWVDSMSRIMCDCSNVFREPRKQFSRLSYLTIRTRLKLMNIGNVIEKFLKESLTAAIPFGVEYLKKRINDK